MTDQPERRALLLGGGLMLGSAAIGAARVGVAGSAQEHAPAEADASRAFDASFRALSADRTSPPDLRGWGVGAIATPRGLWRHSGPFAFADSQVGFALRGDATYATTHLFDIGTGSALPLKTYVAVVLSDFYLRNVAPAPGTSVGIGLNPIGGGGLLTVKRVAIDGFATAIALTGTANGDKTLVEQVSFGTAVGFDRGGNTQAVGWTFLNCTGACPLTHFRLSGAGEILIAGYVGNVFGSFLELPEGSGNGGAGNFPARITVANTQLEYHGNGARLLVDAGRSRELTDRGGSNVDLVLRDVSLVSGATPPDPRTHVVIQVGDERAGNDAIRVKQEGGWIEGVIRHGSTQQGALNRRWSFRDALRAPDPRTLDLRGAGNHPMMEWRANENVPVDQYRGGQGFTGAIDAQKAFLWRHIGAALINTGAAARTLSGRYGDEFEIGGFPPGTTQLGLAVFLDAPLPASIDLDVQQLDATRAPAGASRRLPSGASKGLHPVHSDWHILGDGALYVRITLPGRDLAVRGALVIFYFPYMGS